MALQDDELTDDYVASLLKRDAERLSRTGVADGLSLGAGPRPKTQAKPNTRFFRHIIRETDSHNAALKAREEAEARARAERTRRKAEDEAADGTDKRRRRTNRDHEDERRYEGRDGDRRRHRHDDGKRREKHRHAHSDEHRTRSFRDGEDHDKPRRRARSPSPPRRGASPVRRPHERDRRSQKHRRSPERRSRSPRKRSSPVRDAERVEDGYASDESIGPQPPARGRGAQSSRMSTIDSRFAPDYDPRSDVALEEPDVTKAGDDWSNSLAAVRARADWRDQGGASAKSKDSAGNGLDVQDLRWRKSDEEREWDRGKLLDGDSVDIRPAWTSRSNE